MLLPRLAPGVPVAGGGPARARFRRTIAQRSRGRGAERRAVRETRRRSVCQGRCRPEPISAIARKPGRGVRLRFAEVIPVTGRKWTATATGSLASPIADVSTSFACVRYAKKRPAQCACPYEQRPGGCDDAHIG